MWRRKTSPDAESTRGANAGAGALGVGVQVYVRESEPPAGDDWVGEPTGVIVAPGERSLRSVSLPSDRLTTWVVAFAEPQYRRDGRGPAETATVPASRLVAAEPVED
ncbi:hypothetical protein [Leifsonia sp. WHRI 6310E]|uniref:hypothetical protein n=1 Tax=Leifsonia sp. WHRI 6310E TaxID=3162562 RepID=UPI0032F05FD1